VTGSAKVRGSNIVIGSPIYLDANGFAGLATDNFTAFAVATDGSPVGGIVTYSTDGEVERSDWRMIAGTKFLSLGQYYFLSGTGKLTTSGQQQIGVAKSKTVLSISILQPAESVVQVFTVKGKPNTSLGKIGDIAFDTTALNMWLKDTYGWLYRGSLVFSDSSKPLMLIKNVYGWGPFTMS